MSKSILLTIAFIVLQFSSSTSSAAVMEFCPDLFGQYECVQSSQDRPDKHLLMTITQNARTYIISDSLDAVRLMLIPAQGPKEPSTLSEVPHADCPRSPLDRGIVLRIRALTPRQEIVEQTLIPDNAGFTHRIERGLGTAHQNKGVLVGPKIVRRCTRLR